MARVQVSDEVWAAYRAGLGAMPVSVALGELVRREVGRRARRSASDLEGVRIALEDARKLSNELASLIARLERAGSAPRRSEDLDSWSQRESPHWADHLR
jgi:Arc/MetJ-type ribon-helix-helix transcriptional regulator